MLAVLWIIATLAVLALTTGAAARRALGAAERERDQTAGRWIAEGCIAEFRAALDDSLANSTRSADVWRAIDTTVLGRGAAESAGCDLSARTDGRIVLERATEEVLDSLPGMSFEAVAKTLTARASGLPTNELLSVEKGLSPSAMALFDTHYVELSHLVTIDPDAWIVRSRSHLGNPPTPVNIEARLVRVGHRAAIVRWVEW